MKLLTATVLILGFACPAFAQAPAKGSSDYWPDITIHALNPTKEALATATSLIISLDPTCTNILAKRYGSTVEFVRRSIEKFSPAVLHDYDKCFRDGIAGYEKYGYLPAGITISAEYPGDKLK